MASDTAADPRSTEDIEREKMVATLSHRQRLAIFRALGISPGMGSAELSARLGLPVATVRKQLRKLMELGMVHVREREVNRGAQKLYFAHTRSILITDEQEAGLSRRQRQRIDLNILRNFLGDARRAIASPDHGARPGRMVAGNRGRVDERAWQELSELHHETLERMQEIIDAGRERVAAGDDESVTFTTGLFLLELPERDAGPD